MSQEIQVEINGQAYSVGGGLDPEYVRELARTVDAKMRALAEQTDTLDSRRLAVLAALNLADELQQLRARFNQEHAALPREFAGRVEECRRQLESALSVPSA